MVPYSRRIRPPQPLGYEISLHVRKRIVENIKLAIFEVVHRERLYANVAQICRGQYGELRVIKNPLGYALSPRSQESHATEHFYACSDAEAVDFCEFLTTVAEMMGVPTVRVAINGLLEEESIGFEVILHADGKYSQGVAIKKTNEVAHANVVEPTLRYLTKPVFAKINNEMLKAFAHLRAGDPDEANVAAIRALETMLKTIFDAKNWQYDPKKSTISPLVEVAVANGLLLDIHRNSFIGSGSIGNDLGRHGKGQQPTNVNSPELSEQLLQQVCSQVLLLARRSGL